MCKLKHFLKIIRLRRFPFQHCRGVWVTSDQNLSMLWALHWLKQRCSMWSKSEYLYMRRGFLKKTLVRTAEHFSSGCFCLWISEAAPATLLKKRLWHRCFPVNFAKFRRTSFSQNTSGWLVLAICKKNPIQTCFLLHGVECLFK